MLGAAYGAGRILGGAMDVEQQEIRLQTVINADDGDARAAVRRAREHAIKVARTSLASQSEILDIQYALNSAGLSEQASRVGSEIVSKVATVIYGMPEQVAEIIGTTFNNMGDVILRAPALKRSTRSTSTDALNLLLPLMPDKLPSCLYCARLNSVIQPCTYCFPICCLD